MEQQNVSNGPNQVTHIVEVAKEKVELKEAYNVKAATVLGIIHIICGIIAFGTGIGMGSGYY